MTGRLVRVSRFLSKHLRHQPGRIGLALSAGRMGDGGGALGRLRAGGNAAHTGRG